MTDLLDCTLRDGGYYTDWDFDDGLVDQYLSAMRSVPVTHVELGYLSPAKSGYMGRYFYLNADDIAYAKEALRPDQTLAVMLNAKDVNPSLVERLVSPVSGLIDMVRYACPPSQLAEGIELARAAKAQGVQVMMNVMYLTQYVDDVSSLSVLADAEDVIDAVALVDSYGGCLPDQVERAVRAVADTLPQPVGFHGHNNVSLAMANSIAAIAGGASIVDGTVTGMGRGAGNVQTELMVAYLDALGEDVNFARLAGVVERFEEMRKRFGWGPSLPYMVSGFANLPQAEVMDWLAKRRYTAASVIDALRGRSGSERDEADFPSLASGRPDRHDGSACIIIGGGASARRHRQAIERLAERDGLPIIQSSLRNADVLQTEGRYVCVAGQELAKWSGREIGARLTSSDTLITAPPPRFKGSLLDGFDVRQVNVPDEFEGASLGPVSDVAPIQLALTAARELGATTIYMIGYDGYDTADVSRQKLVGDVELALRATRIAHPELGIYSLVPTNYDLPVRSLYGLLADTGS